jgi:hypothetical protein
MAEKDLSRNVQAAQFMADMQPSGSRQYSQQHQISSAEPGSSSSSKISAEDLKVMREKFPQLNDFSEQFLQSRTLEELLRIESTSLRIRDSEKARETEERLAQNKAGLASKFYDVPAGRDNRWSSYILPGFCRAWLARPPSNSREDARSLASTAPLP